MKTAPVTLSAPASRPMSEYAALLIAAATVVLFLSAWFTA
ncbi:hypothetical protein SAMN05428971_0718 [Candidatus Pantoea varia]|uniref:Uncharacterized protein n=1 Tax=Candidatus Pantoea varia TaxID=1881036 RepID=A0A1I4XGM8_9GAMM|nr:hypothetical protein SAMN05428971_0718 [Pantoea varia]